MACVTGLFQWVSSLHATELLQVGDYKLEEALGRGTYGEVREATNVVTGRPAAVKMVRDGKMTPEELQAEVDNQRRLDHPCVIRILESLKSDGYTCIAMELMPCGNLLAHLDAREDGLPDNDARRFFQQLIMGVEHCHSRGVVHRDLRLDNLMLDAEKNLKITDFGLSAVMVEGEQLTKSCGSLPYAAPELLSDYVAYDGPEIDVWSCGVILYTLLTNTLPFDADSINELKHSIRKGEYDVPFYVRPEANNLLRKILIINSSKRISIVGICGDKWFQKGLLVQNSIVPPVEPLVHKLSSALEDGEFGIISLLQV